MAQALTSANSAHQGLTAREIYGTFVRSLVFPLLLVLPLAWMIGAMQYFVLALAVGLAAWVYRNPKEAVAAGTLFLIACQVILPSSARFDYLNEPWELYYWAVGLLIITLAAAMRTGLANLLRIPTSLKVFLLVAGCAALVGLRNGASFSYAFRQLYGSVLFVVYFAIAYHMGDEDLVLRRLRDVALIFAVLFFIYYAAIFNEYGFHKEISSIGTLSGIIAILCFVKSLGEKNRTNVAAAVVLSCVPAILFWRHMVLAVAFGVVVTLALVVRSKLKKLVLFSVGALILLPSIAPSGAEIILERAMNIPAIENLLPGGTRDVTSLVDRNIQIFAALAVLQRSPLFGDGFGNELSWDSAVRGVMAQAYVDNGWAYVAVKMGVLGLVAFGWVLFTVLRHISRDALGISVALLAIILVVQFSEPVMFQFSTSPLCGALCGLLVARGRSSSTASTTSEKVELAHV